MSARSFVLNKHRQGNITVTRTSSDYVVRLHRTDVVTYDALARTIQFRTGGWHTPTTRKAINRALTLLSIPWYVYAKKGTTMLKTEHSEVPMPENQPLDVSIYALSSMLR